MGLFSMFKRNAKFALRRNWGRAIIILLIVFGVTALLSVLQQIAMRIFVLTPAPSYPFIGSGSDPFQAAVDMFTRSVPEWIILASSSLLTLLLVSPLSLGVYRWFWQLVTGYNAPVSEIFYCFDSGRAYGRALWYDVNMTVRCALWAIPFFAAPSIILSICVFFLRAGSEPSRGVAAIASTGIFLSVILFLLASLFYVVCINRYALVPYLLAEDPDISVRQAFKTSVAYTKGFRFSLFWFMLSYIGWYLLYIFVFPILYVYPYFCTGVAMYARYMIEKNRMEQPNGETREFRAMQEPPAVEPTFHPGTEPEAEAWDSPFRVETERERGQWPEPGPDDTAR